MLRSINFGELEIQVIFHELSLYKETENNLTELCSFCEGQWEEDEPLCADL